MLYSCNEVLLCGASIGGDKYRVVATDIANDLWPVAAIKSERYSLCRTDRGFDNQQIGASGLNRSKQLSNRGQLFIVVLTSSGQFVTASGLYGTEFSEITAHAGLGRAKALARQRGDERALRFQRAFLQHSPYRIASLFVMCVWHSSSRINMHII